MFRGFRTRAMPSTAGRYTPRSRRKMVRGYRRAKPASAALAVAKQALRTARKVAAERELKMLENAVVNQDMGNDISGVWPNAAGAVVGNGGAVLPLCFMTAGTGDSQRVGEQVQAKGFEVRGHFAMLNMDQPNIAVRFIIFRDKQQRSSGTTPLPFEVLQVTRTNSLLLWDNQDRFEILVDDTKYASASEPSAAHAGCPRYPFHYKRKLNFPIHWTSTSSNAVDKNGLFMLVIADTAENFPAVDSTATLDPASNQAIWDCTARFVYTDA